MLMRLNIAARIISSVITSRILVLNPVSEDMALRKRGEREEREGIIISYIELRINFTMNFGQYLLKVSKILLYG